MYEMTKPKLSVTEQIDRLTSKGIKFDITSKDEAIDYLSKNSNYFKLTSYRKSFAKHPDGKLKGKYINLDFEWLKDLSIIDMRLRYTFMHMALDVEHFSKVRLLKVIEESDEDGYGVVASFLANLSGDQYDAIMRELSKVKGNPYCGDIIAKYDNDFPVWAFIEIITFGWFITFYIYCAKNVFEDRKLENEAYLLLASKDLRNAVAHNNCLINNLLPNTIKRATNYYVSNELSRIGVTKSIRDKKMSNVRIQQIVTLLYTHKKIVTSPGINEHQCDVLNETIQRMFRNIDFYSSNETIFTTFKFLKYVIDKWFPCSYNVNT